MYTKYISFGNLDLVLVLFIMYIDT